MSIMDLKSPATGLFIQKFVPAMIKGSIKGPYLSHLFLKFKRKYRWKKFNEILVKLKYVQSQILISDLDIVEFNPICNACSVTDLIWWPR